MSDRIELSKREYHQLKQALEEYADLVDSYGGSFADEVRATRESLDNISTVKYELPISGDIEAGIQLLKLRHGRQISSLDTSGWASKCSCGAVYVQLHENVECSSCGKVHEETDQSGGGDADA